MRILGFEKIDWPNYHRGLRSKLLASEFTTWRFPRKDRDWELGEQVQIVIKPRTPDRIVLGHAVIVEGEPRQYMFQITNKEARVDGFPRGHDMTMYLSKERHSRRLDFNVQPNKLTLRWTLWLPPMIDYLNRGGIYL